MRDKVLQIRMNVRYLVYEGKADFPRSLRRSLDFFFVRGRGESFIFRGLENHELIHLSIFAGQYKTWTTDYGLRTGYKTRTQV